MHELAHLPFRAWCPTCPWRQSEDSGHRRVYDKTPVLRTRACAGQSDTSRQRFGRGARLTTARWWDDPFQEARDANTCSGTMAQYCFAPDSVGSAWVVPWVLIAGFL